MNFIAKNMKWIVFGLVVISAYLLYKQYKGTSSTATPNSATANTTKAASTEANFDGNLDKTPIV